MNEQSFSLECFKKTPIVGILRGIPLKACIDIAHVYFEAGFYSLEITMNTDNAPEIISSLRKQFPKLNVGAGTVCNLKDLNNALEAGAQFIVTPIINENVIDNCVIKNIPVFPGAYTPTEIFNAWSLGATAVKVFPATQLGTQYIKDVLAPLNQIKLLPTGGVSINNIKSFFEVGAFGVGMGSSLFVKQLIKERNYIELKNHFNKVKNSVNEFII